MSDTQDVRERIAQAMYESKPVEVPYTERHYTWHQAAFTSDDDSPLRDYVDELRSHAGVAIAIVREALLSPEVQSAALKEIRYQGGSWESDMIPPEFAEEEYLEGVADVLEEALDAAGLGERDDR